MMNHRERFLQIRDFLKPYQRISDEISQLNKNVTLIVVTKTFSIDHIKPLVKYGHIHFGENKVQEALNKWSKILSELTNLKLHMLGKIQTNKAHDVVSLFSYVHSLDSEKLVLKLSKAEKDLSKKLKYFVQINIGSEIQKSGIQIHELKNFFNFCTKENNLNIIGLMCLPPIETDPVKYFLQLKNMAYENNFYELSMGMSNDYKVAVENGSTFIRIGSKIFGARLS
jgi:pyridoxal phosphate enzyme (YggS family)